MSCLNYVIVFSFYSEQGGLILFFSSDLSDIGISASILHLHSEKIIKIPNCFGDEKLVSEDKLIP